MGRMMFGLLLIFTFISTIFSGGVFDTNGKLSQVEFAYQATLKSGTIVASQSKDSIVVVAITPKHFDYTQDTQRITPLNSNAYICGTGISADVRYLTNKAFESSLEHSATFGSDVPILKMAEDLAEIIHANTFSESIRPYGASLILLGQGSKKGSYEIIELDPLGNMHRCLLSCVGCFSKEILNSIPKDQKLKDSDSQTIIQLLVEGVKKTLQESEKKIEDYNIQLFQFIEGEKLKTVNIDEYLK